MAFESAERSELSTHPRPASVAATVPSVRCSVVDVLLQNVPVPVTFTFERRLEPQPLLEALQRTLESFPVFSGRLRLTDEDLHIDCKGEGISTSIVHLDEDFVPALEALGTGQSYELCEAIDPRKCVREGAPLLTVRFNQPRDRGTILGICWHHTIGDLSTLMSLLSAWQATSRGEAFEAPVIPADRHDTFLQAGRGRGSPSPGIRRLGLFELARFSSYITFQAKKQELVRCYFSDAELETMREVLSEKAGVRLSRNAVLCAHIASVIFPLDPKKRSHTLAMAIDFRSRLGLPSQMLGNFIGGLLVRVERDALEHEVAQEIREAVETAVDRHFNYEASHRLLEAGGGPRAAGRHVSLGIDPMRGTLLITNWSKFGVNEISFQGARCSGFFAGGRPPFPWLSSITEGPYDRGLVYSVSLPPKIGKALRRAENVARMHRYRPARDVLPDEVTRIRGWL